MSLTAHNHPLFLILFWGEWFLILPYGYSRYNWLASQIGGVDLWVKIDSHHLCSGYAVNNHHSFFYTTSIARKGNLSNSLFFEAIQLTISLYHDQNLLERGEDNFEGYFPGEIVFSPLEIADSSSFLNREHGIF